MKTSQFGNSNRREIPPVLLLVKISAGMKKRENEKVILPVFRVVGELSNAKHMC